VIDTINSYCDTAQFLTICWFYQQSSTVGACAIAVDADHAVKAAIALINW
jgi:hypothetical protein